MSKISLSLYRIVEIISKRGIDGKMKILYVKLGDYSYKKCAIKRVEKFVSKYKGSYHVLFIPFPFCDDSLIQIVYSHYS